MTEKPNFLPKLKLRWTDFRNGVESGYPICCVVRFSLSRWDAQAARRCSASDPREWVTCGIFHRDTGIVPDPSWEKFLRPGWQNVRYGERRLMSHDDRESIFPDQRG